MSSNESKIPVGQILVGKYRVVREIGRGGMAAVYEAEQLSLGKKVAVKILAAELSASTIVIERFFREARAAASIKSPYIVDVYDSGRLDDGRPFITMEMLEGESLYDRMARVRLIDIETTTRVIVHSAKGLMKAHAAGIVHRDLKPENIFLTKGEDGEELCKILDFGLAKFYAPVNPEEKAQKRLTREGAVFGTPAYMSPEQVKGQGNVDHRADLWALGCMAFECLIGRPVWNMDQGVAMTFAAIATGPVPVPSQIRSDLPPEFDAWFKKCLERDPNKRYQSAKELADAFVQAWGQARAQSSNQSFPSFTSSSGARAPGGVAPELALDMVEGTEAPVPPPAPTTGRGGRAPSPINGARGSAASDAFPLVQRASADVPPASQPTVVPVQTSPVRMVMSALFLAVSVSAALFVWLRVVSPQVFAPLVRSTASAPVSAAPVGSGPTTVAVEEPSWVATIAEGQKSFSTDSALAGKKFQDAIAMGGQAAVVGRVFAEQLKIATNPKESSGPCKAVSLSRPRLNTERRGERPAVLTTAKGSLVVWVDDHEQSGKDHVYGVMTDATGKSIGPIRDLTPEAADAQRPQLIAQSTDRSVLVWSDKSGREAGVRARFLDPDGRIDTMKGQSVLVGAARPGEYWPSIEKGREGFIVVWQDDRAKDKDYDIFARRLTAELDTAGPETRLTDYHVKKGAQPRVHYPTLAVAPSTLLVAYRLDKDKDHDIMRLRLPLDELEKSEKTAGLPESKDGNRETRVLGNDVVKINKDKEAGDQPSIACGKEGCFAVWQSEPSGASYAFIDPNVGKVQWTKKFAERGAHPSIAVNDQGQVAVSYFEGGRIKIAFLSRDGVTGASTLLRVHDMSAPRPSLSAGAAKNEWLLAWQDSDSKGASSEVYASRVSCK